MTATVYTVSGPPAATASASPTLAEAITAAQTLAGAAASSASTALASAGAAASSATTASEALATITAIENTIVADLSANLADVQQVAAELVQLNALAVNLAGNLGQAISAEASATAAATTALNAATSAASYASTASTEAAAAVAAAATFTPSLYLASANNLSDVASAATALSNLGGAPLASPALTGTPTAPTVSSPSDSTTKIATTGFVHAVTASLAPLVSPALTGTPTAPTAATSTNTTQLATTAFVKAAIAAVGPAAVTTVFGRTGDVVAAANDYSFGQLSGSLGSGQLPALTGDVTTSGFAATLANIGNDVTMAGDLLVSTMAAPARPGSGTARFYVDNVENVLSLINASGVVSISVVPSSGAAHQFATAISAGGVIAWGHPASTDISDFDTAVNALVSSGYAPLASPALTGVPTAPTAAPGTSTTQLATTSFVEAAVLASVTGVATFNGRGGTVVPASGDYTVAEVTGAAPLASPGFTGSPTAPTLSPGTNTTEIATTAFVETAVNGLAPLASPSFSGTVTLPDSATITSSGYAASGVSGGAKGAGTINVTAAYVGGVALANYTLPAATSSTLGGVKPDGTTLTNSSGAISVTYGTAANTAAQGNDSRITGALAKANNLSDVAVAATALANLGGAPLASPTFSGTPAAPTATGGTNTTQLATTAFVAAALSSLTVSQMPADVLTASIEAILDGGGVALASGNHIFLEVPFPCTINRVTLLGDVTGSVTVDIWKVPYASFPPSVSNSICASDVPAISSAQKYQDSTLTGWTKTINAGDILCFNIKASATSTTRVTCSLAVTKT